MNTKCAVLVTTCDDYSDAWDPFFRLFKIMWPDCQYPVYLNTETMDYDSCDICVNCLHPKSLTNSKGKTISWSDRLRQSLEKIDTDYILFFLEDFFLQSPVRSSVVEDCVQWMDEDKNVVFIDFYRNKKENEIIYRNEFSLIKRDYDWAINANCALWRKDFLLNILRDENPWEFEINATYRWRRTNYKIYTHRGEFAKVFDYQFETVNGEWSGIIKGKWLSAVPELLNKYGIEVDYTKRGLITPPNYLARKRETHWLWHDFICAIRSPRMMAHYIVCTKNVIKDKVVRLWRTFFNR